MALNEACQIWIEQRIQEELSERGDTGKSLREIGREIAAEIERVFEAKVHPNTIRMKAARKISGTNVPPPETPATMPVQAGNTGNTENAISEISRLHGEICNAGGELLVETLARKLTPQEVAAGQSSVNRSFTFMSKAVAMVARVSRVQRPIRSPRARVIVFVESPVLSAKA